MYPLSRLHENEDPEKHVRVLKALLSVVRTAFPSPPHQIQRLATEGRVGRDARLGLTRAYAQTPVYPPPLPSPTPSLNIAWLQDVLAHGLPFSLIRLISYDTLAMEWHYLPEGQSLCQLTAHLGFIPIPLVESEVDDAGKSNLKSSRQLRPRKSTSRRKGLKTEEMLDMSEDAQRERAREQARPHAFDMGYLSRRRHWGPYLAVRRRRPVASEPSGDEGAASLDGGEAETDTESDTDYVPPDDASASSATPEPAPDPAPPVARSLPSPADLRPDWTWLAAARIVAECKLRQHVDAEDITKLENWNNLREGAWVPEPRKPELGSGSADEEEPLQVDASKADEAVEEWKKYERDWAGAEGVWRSVDSLSHQLAYLSLRRRRLVCWLDYDDLICTCFFVPSSHQLAYYLLADHNVSASSASSIQVD